MRLFPAREHAHRRAERRADPAGQLASVAGVAQGRGGDRDQPLHAGRVGVPAQLPRPPRSARAQTGSGMLPSRATSAPRRSISRSRVTRWISPARRRIRDQQMEGGAAEIEHRHAQLLAPRRRRVVPLGEVGLAVLGGRRLVAGPRAAPGLGVHDPDGALLADQLALEAQALVAEALDHARDHVAVRAQHGGVAVQLVEQGERARRRASRAESRVDLDRKAAQRGQRLERLAAAQVRAREQMGDAERRRTARAGAVPGGARRRSAAAASPCHATRRGGPPRRGAPSRPSSHPPGLAGRRLDSAYRFIGEAG